MLRLVWHGLSITRDWVRALASVALALLPLWIVGVVTAAGRRPRLGFLGFFALWTVTSVAWGQLLPRLGAWEGLFPVAVWATTLVGVWLIAQPSVELLRRRLGVTAMISAGFVAVIVGLGSIPTRAMLQVLGWGHDNSAHIFLAEANAYCGGLLSACRLDLEAVPSYLIEYPQGFSVTWASLPGAFASSGLLDSLHAYAAIYLLTSLALVMVTSWLAVSLTRKSTWTWGAGLLAGLTVTLGIWSHQLWSGFASFLWTSLIVVAFITLRESELLGAGRLWFGFALMSLVSVHYSHQLLLPFLFVYVVVDALINRRSLLGATRQSPWVLSILALAALVLALLAPRSAQGNSFVDQVVVEAGMEAIPLWVWIPLAITGGFILFARGDRDRVALRWSMLTGGLMFGAVALLTIQANGYVSYYPMKLLYFLVLVMIAATSAVVVQRPIDTRARQAWFTLSGLAVLALAVLPPLLRYPGFKTAYQGSTPTVLRTLTTHLYGGGVGLCAPFVLDAVDQLPPDTGRVEVYRAGVLHPLEGRWINEIRGNWNTEAWVNEVDWRPMSEIPSESLPDAIITHDGVGASPSGVLRLDLGEPCDRRELPPVLPIG